MAKKPKAPRPDSDGFLRTGIYSRYVGPPKEQTWEEMDAQLRLLAERYSQTVSEWLDRWRKSLKKLIEAFIEPTRRQPMPGTIYGIDFGDGVGAYRIRDSVVEGTPGYETTLDAIDALNEIRVILHHVGPDDTLIGRLEWVVNASYRLGGLIARINVRPYEPIVATEISRRKKRGAKRTKETRLTAEQWGYVRSFVERRVRDGVTASKACVQASAQLLTGTFPKLKGKPIDISAKTLQNLWSNRNNK